MGQLLLGAGSVSLLSAPNVPHGAGLRGSRPFSRRRSWPAKGPTESTNPISASFSRRSSRVGARTRPKRANSFTMARGPAHRVSRASSKPGGGGEWKGRDYRSALGWPQSPASPLFCNERWRTTARWPLPPLRRCRPLRQGRHVAGTGPCYPSPGSTRECGGTLRSDPQPPGCHATRQRCPRSGGWRGKSPSSGAVLSGVGVGGLVVFILRPPLMVA